MKTQISLTDILVFMLGMLGDGFNWLVDAFKTNKAGTAFFGREQQIASRWNHGLLISKNRRLSRRRSNEGLLLCGNTGSGKTSTLILRQLYLLKNASIICNDPSMELFIKSSNYLSQFFDVKVLNFSDASKSIGYNFLADIKDPKSNEVNKIADLFVRSTLEKNGSSDPFWGLMARDLIVTFTRLILYQPEQYRHMAGVLNVVNIFSYDPKKVDQWVVATKDEALIASYKSIIAMPSKTLLSVVASAKAALQIFSDPEVAKVTSHHSLSFSQLRREPIVLFIHISTANAKYLNLLVSLYFEQFYSHVLQSLPKKGDKQLYVILEELSSLQIGLLPIALANCRKFDVSTLCAIQSPPQLKAMYKDDWQNIVSQCVTKVFLPGSTNIELLREIEQLSGTTTYKDSEGHHKTKPLVTVDEIRRLGSNRSLVLSSNHALIKGRTLPYFKAFKHKGYAKLPPVPLHSDIPTEPIKLLQ